MTTATLISDGCDRGWELKIENQNVVKEQEQRNTQVTVKSNWALKPQSVIGVG